MAVFATITGNPQVGQLFTASGSANGGETLTGYEWQNASSAGGTFAAIAGATSITYTTTGSDTGKHIRCVISYDDGGQTVYGTSNVIGRIGRGSGGGSNNAAPSKPAAPPVPQAPQQRRMSRIVPVDFSKWNPARRPKR